MTHDVETLQNRSDFLACARGKRQGTKGMMVQALKRPTDTAEPDLIRVGFTCSKKVGNAVARNRAKRRLREVARLLLPEHGRPGWDYVLIGSRENTAARPFAELQSDLLRALAKLHA
jgi:ribonuclease P protein component